MFGAVWVTFLVSLCTIFCQKVHCVGSTSALHECYQHSEWIGKKSAKTTRNVTKIMLQTLLQFSNITVSCVGYFLAFLRTLCSNYTYHCLHFFLHFQLTMLLKVPDSHLKETFVCIHDTNLNAFYAQQIYNHFALFCPF